MDDSFCQDCWTATEYGEARCPSCGADLTCETTHSYEEKVLLALTHPMPEHRISAIRLLANRRSERAIHIFADILSSDPDFDVAREVLQGAVAIGTASAWKLVEKATQHPFALVREHAQRLLMTQPQCAAE